MRHVISLDYWGITTGPPPETSVALKNGSVPIVDGNWKINSICYVTSDGRSYVAAVLTNENPGEYNGIETTDESSSRVWSTRSSQAAAAQLRAPSAAVADTMTCAERNLDPTTRSRVRAPIPAPKAHTPAHFAVA